MWYFVKSVEKSKVLKVINNYMRSLQHVYYSYILETTFSQLLKKDHLYHKLYGMFEVAITKQLVGRYELSDSKMVTGMG